MKRMLTLLTALLLAGTGWAQSRIQGQPVQQNAPVEVTVKPVIDTSFFTLPAEITDAYLDSVGTRFDRPINDYVLFGVHGGAAFNHTYFNPPWEAKFHTHLPVFGASVTIHGKLFGFMPYFGLEIGVQHTYEGFQFKENKETKITRNLEGVENMVMDVWEVPFLMAGHADIGENFKLLAKVGIFGGYRTSVTRTGPFTESTRYKIREEVYSPWEYRESFRDFDLRWTYGLEGGVGMGLMFSPFEFHVNALVKWGWGSFYRPDYYNDYYYRFGYPLDLMVTAGIYYQLTPRRGYTRHQLKKIAKQIVYGE